MTTARMLRAVRMRPIANAQDPFTARRILAPAATDDRDVVRALIPSSTTPNPVEMAEDGSLALFEFLYNGTEWDAHRRGAALIARILVLR